MAVKFTSWAKRTDVATMLEGPVRIIRQRIDDKAAWDDIEAILAELDRRDLVSQAQTTENIRQGRLREEIRARLVVPATGGETCAEEVYRGNYGRQKKEPCGHKARSLVVGKPYCGTHVKRPAETAESREFYRLERERHEAGTTTPAEDVIYEDMLIKRRRQEVVDVR